MIIFIQFFILIGDINQFNFDNALGPNFLKGDDGKYYVFGSFFIRSLSKEEKMLEKLKLDINIRHKMVPPLFGYDFRKDEEEIIEIRKISFEPLIFNKKIM